MQSVVDRRAQRLAIFYVWCPVIGETQNQKTSHGLSLQVFAQRYALARFPRLNWKIWAETLNSSGRIARMNELQ